MAGTNNLSCCAVMEITSLSTHANDPETALFTALTSNVYDYGLSERVAKLVYVYGHYIFTCVEEYKGSESASNDTEPREYGATFAAYLRSQALGVVTAGELGPNHQNHPNHLVRVYIWTVDKPAVIAWYARVKVEREARKKVEEAARAQKAAEVAARAAERKAAADLRKAALGAEAAVSTPVEVTVTPPVVPPVLLGEESEWFGMLRGCTLPAQRYQANVSYRRGVVETQSPAPIVPPAAVDPKFLATPSRVRKVAARPRVKKVA